MTDTCPTHTEHPLTLSLPVQRHRDGRDERVQDLVAEEVPVALVFNGISHAVMMASPADLEEFATGFALSEGILAAPGEIRDLEILQHTDGIEIAMTIAEPAFLALKDHRRSLTGRTGCGVCGTESLSLLDLTPERVSPANFTVDHAAIRRILAELPAHQPLTQATGCAHAAAWCSPAGEIQRVFEDVGRHNALDKLLGWLALRRIDHTDGFVFLTSRASYELVRKVARRNIATLATISAPTALAIRLAHDAGIRLLSFCRDKGFVEYPAESAPPSLAR
ncbi:formate dehydrogenase accessory sulfurtransferase FdhD [Uliginosibacterium sp. 31-16]|uniref:formate dehydrogenase accessory sulfurtransferase FdhD n=1 Tax=Uliginosibacterium sp. 31-16 TaxID=3068315 RepID=UPI00273DF941|nr:formate dehydrogenase accessory sulfurtransferase FdhD [Uliginosibacterium sp. 31-16]MDP5240914.1 formate dehydrogenase accessory sulfurtransferase FdhD [Uliginosibacterium sp. 31-16]